MSQLGHFRPIDLMSGRSALPLIATVKADVTALREIAETVVAVDLFYEVPVIRANLGSRHLRHNVGKDSTYRQLAGDL
jgi:hypothetical protein